MVPNEQNENQGKIKHSPVFFYANLYTHNFPKKVLFIAYNLSLIYAHHIDFLHILVYNICSKEVLSVKVQIVLTETTAISRANKH